MRGRRERRNRAEEARFAKTRVQLHRDKAASGYCTAGDSSNVLPWASGEGLVLEPQAALTAATAAARSNWSVGGLKRCAIIVDRHTHKNGGSTVRDIFLENERLGYGLYQGYTQLGWNSDWRNVRRLADAAVGEGRTPSLLLMIEAHFGQVELKDRPMQDLAALRAFHLKHRVDCPIVLVTRVREPLDYYLSFFRWGVAFRIKEALATGRGKGKGALSRHWNGAAAAPRRPMWGHNFSEWAAQVPNLQSTIMARGMAASGAEYYGRMHGGPRPKNAQKAWQELDEMLSAFDVVGTVSRFDETLLLAADLVGLPVLTYKYNRPNQKGGYRGTNADICPDREACAALIRELAPRDHRMWAKYSAAFEARLAALGPAFARRVAGFKSAVKRAQPAWEVAPRAQTICRYHPETGPRARELAFPNLRCPVGEAGGKPLCQHFYAHRLFECPWQYVPNSSLTDSLGCWRPSSGFL